MSGYTKGPWKVEGGGIRAIVRGDDVTIVAVRHRLPAKVHEANAHLMAAAPDLYEALEMVRDADEDCKKDGSPTIPSIARAKIDAAIRKAEGK